jgi:putative membrane protein
MRTSRPLIVAYAVLVAGCADSDASARAYDTAGRRDSVAGVAAGSMKEEHVIGLLEWSHEADSALGVLGATRGSTLEIKDFGRMISREHGALRRDALAMARHLGLTPQPPPVLPDMPPEALRAMVDSIAPGRGWDQAYLQLAFEAHKSAVENYARALAATRSPEVKRYIERSAPILQKHLDRVQRLQKTGGEGDGR